MGLRSKLGEIRRGIETPKNKWSDEALAKGILAGYQQNHGYSFDLTNPILFTEKLQWYKLYYENPSLVNAVDKYLFKNYIAERLGKGYTLPLFGVWDNLNDFANDWPSLPKEFVLKSTLQSDGKFIKVIHDKSQLSLKQIKKEVRQWLNPRNTLINSYCKAYHKATPRIIAEEYMEQVDNQLYDYKFFCFSGVPHCIYVATDHFPGQLSHISFYDLDWKRLDVQYGKHPNCDVGKPKHYDKMLEISRKLSAEFPFVRVDFFDTDAQLYVAELTFYPGGGLTPYHPKAFNKELGGLFVLPER